MRVLILLTFFAFSSINLNAQAVKMVKELRPGFLGAFDYANGTQIFAGLDSICIFLASAENNTRLFCRSDGTDLGTQSLLPPLATGVRLVHYTVSEGLFWFVLNDADNHSKLYSTDGTWQGTILRKDETQARINLLNAYPGGVLFGRSPDNTDPDELIRMNLNAGQVQEMILAKCYYFGGLMTVAVQDSTIWAIGAKENVSDRYLFKCTGQANSRTDISLINTGSEFNQTIFLTPVGDRVFWFWEKNNEPYSLWVSDGTTTGTKAVMPFAPLIFQNLIKEKAIIAFEDKLYFRSESIDEVGLELWVSDGTTSGTLLVKDFNTGYGDGMPHKFHILNGELFVVAKDDSYNEKVWRVKTSSPPTANQAFTGFEWNNHFGTEMTIFRDSLAFGGETALSGAEVFLASNHPTSYKIVSDESPAGNDSYYPYNFTATKNLLFYTADKTSIGRELWVYDPNSPATSSAKEVTLVKPLNLYPNPATEFISFAFGADLPIPDGYILYAYDAAGKNILQKSVDKGSEMDTKVDISHWESGIYQIMIIGNNGLVFGGKFVKQ